MIPPHQNAEFVYHMEDVLEVYQRPPDPGRPLVCLDEASRQLVGEVRKPLPARPGEPERYDTEYSRNGVASLFMAYSPLEGRRRVWVRERRTRQDWAAVVRELVDVHYREAERIVLVQDRLNTHSPASLYATFPPEEARRLARKLEIHYTPAHGSWLNMAEIELSALSRQCLDRRIPDVPAMRDEVEAWQTERNAHGRPADWRFTTQDARIRLQRMYPSINT